MDLKRGEKCFVCGKDGTAKEPANRVDVPFKIIRSSRTDLEDTIRRSAKVDGGSLRVVAETAGGTKTLDSHSKLGRGVVRGDYLMVLAEGKNGEYRESILRLA
jgi:hypothetical protein